MASNYTPSTVGPGVASMEQINNEFQKIKTAMDRLVSRYPDAPNAMQFPLDLGGQDIINVGKITAVDLEVGGIDLASQVQAAQDAADEAAGYAAAAQAAVASAQGYANVASGFADDAEAAQVAAEQAQIGAEAAQAAAEASAADAASDAASAVQDQVDAAEGFKDDAEAAYQSILFLDVVTETGNFTLDDTYTNKMVMVDSSSGVSCTVDYSTVGAQALVVQAGTGAVTFTSSGTILSKLGTVTDGEGSVASVIQWGASDVYINGQLVEA